MAFLPIIIAFAIGIATGAIGIVLMGLIRNFQHQALTTV